MSNQKLLKLKKAKSATPAKGGYYTKICELQRQKRMVYVDIVFSRTCYFLIEAKNAMYFKFLFI